MNLSNRDTLIWLNSLNVSNKSINNIMKQLENINIIWSLSNDKIYNLKGIKKGTKEKIIKNRNKDYFKKMKKILYNSKFNVITILDEIYPSQLKEIYNAPNVLYFIGDIKCLNNPMISIVGSRKITSYGEIITKKLVRELTNLNVTIVSGMALGIDTIAHKECLKNNGKTIAILGNGFSKIYPMKNQNLYNEIKEKGLIITEYFNDMDPKAYNFPQRNRIISGLSIGTIVIEAKERSGSLITAYLALEENREVFAIPGNITSIFSKGTNRLIQDGAKLVSSIDDILEEIPNIRKVDSVGIKEIKLNLNNIEKDIVEKLKIKPLTLNQLKMKLVDIEIRDISISLTKLELKEVIEENQGGVFSLLI